DAVVGRNLRADLGARGGRGERAGRAGAEREGGNGGKGEKLRLHCRGPRGFRWIDAGLFLGPSGALIPKPPQSRSERVHATVVKWFPQPRRAFSAFPPGRRGRAARVIPRIRRPAIS